MNKNEMITKLHDRAMDAINDILIEVQDETLEVGEIPRRYDDWHEDYGPCLWWNTEMTGGEITEPPETIGGPLDSDWPYESEDEKHLLWVPLPKLARGRP